MRFGFLLNEVLTGLRRNVTMTAAMILTTAISIGLFGGGLLVVRLADNSREIYLDRVETQVFLTDDISANDATCASAPCKALRDKVDARQDVKSVRFVNRQDAYNDAIKKFPEFKDVAGRTRSPRRSSSNSTTPNSTRNSTPRCRGSRGCAASLTRRT